MASQQLSLLGLPPAYLIGGAIVVIGAAAVVWNYLQTRPGQTLGLAVNPQTPSTSFDFEVGPIRDGLTPVSGVPIWVFVDGELVPAFGDQPITMTGPDGIGRFSLPQAVGISSGPHVIFCSTSPDLMSPHLETPEVTVTYI